MNNMRYLTGLDDKGPWRIKALERFFGLLFVLALAALSVGCLVGNEEYDQASREVDEYQNQLQSLRLSNDQLNRDIVLLYEECEALNTQLATLAALNIHDNFTENLKRPEPVVTPPPQRPARQPQVRGSGRPSGGSASTPPRQGSGGGQRGSGNQPRAGQQSGGGTPSTPPPPPSRPSGGAIDWGF